MKPFVVSLSSCGLLTLLLSVTNIREDNYVDAQNVLRLGKDFDININDGHTTTTTTTVLPNVVLRSLQGNANGNSNGNANGNAK